MTSARTSFLIAAVGLATWSGCDYTHDIVDPGAYGVVAEAGRGVTAPAVTATGPASGSGGSVAAAPSGGVMAAPSTAPPASTSAPPPMTAPGTGSCDMSGKWLVTMHTTTDGLGNLQYSHDFIYYEIEQQGDALSVKNSLYCGSSTIGGGAFAVTVDYTAATQAALMKHVKDVGRKGTSASVVGGCKVEFGKQYRVLGATLPYYLDPSTTLPSADQMAASGKPGWEDWDSDNQPGVTGNCSGTVNGKIFVASRQWTVLSGTVPNLKSVIKLAVDWDVEPNVMAFDGSPFLGSSAVRAADATLHFAQLVRLSNDQVASDDATTCKNLVALAPMLTPEAAGM